MDIVKKFPFLFIPLFLFSGLFALALIISPFVGLFAETLNNGSRGWAIVFIIGLIAEGIRASFNE